MKAQRKNYQENIVTPYFVSTEVGLLVSQGKEKVTTAWALRFLFPVGAFKKIINFYVYGIWVFCLLVCMYHVCAIPIETRRECWILWNWSLPVLATMLIEAKGNKPISSIRATSDSNH